MPRRFFDRLPWTATLWMMIVPLLSFAIAIPTFSGVSAYPTEAREQGMPDYAGSLEVDDHWFLITQKASNKIEIEERLWFNNTGRENYTGKIYTWSQPQNILSEIQQFGIVSGETVDAMKVYPGGNFLFLNLSETNYTVGPGDSIQLMFKYTLDYPTSGEFQFTKTFLYNNTNIIFIIEPYENYEVESKEGIGLFYKEDSHTFVTEHGVPLSKELGDTISIGFNKFKEEAGGGNGQEDIPGSNSSGGSSKLLFFILFLVVVGAIVTVYMRYKKSYEEQLEQLSSEESGGSSKKSARKGGSTRGRRPARKTGPSPKGARGRARKTDGRTGDRGGRGGKERARKRTESGRDHPGAGEDREELVGDRKRILKTKKRLKRDREDGLISKETYAALTSEYEGRLKEIEDRIDRSGKGAGVGKEREKTSGNKELRDLLRKKERMLRAIKKLEDDKEKGILDEDLFEEMAGAYKKNAVEILKKIDEARERNS